MGCVRWMLVLAIVSSGCPRGNPLRPPPPPTILDTPQLNRKPERALADACEGKTFPVDHPTEWQPLIGGTDDAYAVTGLSGTVVSAKCSGGDLLFTHPMGKDWETYIAVDSRFRDLLADANFHPSSDPDTKDYVDAQAAARAHGVGAGILGTEIEMGMSQPRYHACTVAAVDSPCPDAAPIPRTCQHRPGTFDRAAVFGRWVVDCGHGDYHAEIHPPLLSVVGYAATPQRSEYTVESRPFLTSQYFGGTSWFDFAGKSIATANNVCMATVPTGFPCPWNVEWSATMLPPFSGTSTMVVVVRPQGPASRPDARLKLRGRVYLRRGVTFEATELADGYRIVVTMNGDEYQLPDITKYDHHNRYFFSDLAEECRKTGNAGDPKCQLYGVEFIFLALLTASHPITPDNFVAYRELDIQQIWRDELRNQPIPEVEPATLEVVPAPSSIFPVQGTFSVEWAAGRLAVDPTSIDFALRDGPADITVRSVGASPVAVRAITLGGAAAGDFALLSDTCSNRPLAPGATCTLRVEFTARGFGVRSAALEVPTDAETATPVVSLVGPGNPG